MISQVLLPAVHEGPVGQEGTRPQVHGGTSGRVCRAKLDVVFMGGWWVSATVTLVLVLFSAACHAHFVGQGHPPVLRSRVVSQGIIFTDFPLSTAIPPH
jgi:hypothetical protein